MPNPRVKIFVSGKDVSAEVTSRLCVLEWSDSTKEEADSLALTLTNSDGLLEIPKKGALVSVSAGYGAELQKIGDFNIVECDIDGPPSTMSIKGSAVPYIAKSGNSAIRKKSFSWESTTLGAIAQKIASNLGLSPSINNALASITVANEQQTEESDVNFLLRLTRRFGGYLKFIQGNLVVTPEGISVTTSGKQITCAIKQSDCSKWRFVVGGKAEGVKNVSVKYHDFATGETKSVTAEVAQTATVPAFSDVPWLASEANTITPAAPAADEEQAKAIAKTVSKRVARTTRRATLNMVGNPAIVAGAKATLTGWKEAVNGPWLVTKVEHRVDCSQGWAMTVSLEGVN